MSESKWTDERPTEPGEYWVSLAPHNRIRSMSDSTVPVTLMESRFAAGGWVACLSNGQAYDLALGRFQGALWADRTTPDDPFKVTE